MKLKLVLILAALLTLTACAKPVETVEQTAPQPTAEEVPPDQSQPVSDENARLAAAVEAIVAGVSYTDDNFISEKDFYAALSDILAVHGTDFTPCAEKNAYFEFDYANVTSVKLLTMAKAESEVKKDIETAEAAVKNPDGSAPDLSEGSFDREKEVLSSEDLVTSFVVSASTSQDDQTLMFMAASAALAILDKNYNNTEAAFSALKNNLFALYNNSGGNAVSWIDGLDSEKSYTIPGNGIECWFGQMDDGNYYLAITPYVKYDEIIDIAGSSGSAIGG